ncbi:MAG TPA: hypothetical protein VMT61_00555 [Candidatus Binataceae bacterium]|nr:hypothetical protein [Candidatus Binataceae bacterium]
MARLTPETVKVLAHQLYDYDLSDDSAVSVAHIVGAMTHYLRRLDALPLGGLQPPFGYATIVAEAQRINRGKK